jgi:hypothetical protein
MTAQSSREKERHPGLEKRNRGAPLPKYIEVLITPEDIERWRKLRRMSELYAPSFARLKLQRALVEATIIGRKP